MNNKCASILKLTLSCILGLTFLVGCGGSGVSKNADSKTSPVINNVTYDVDKRQLIVEATDDVKVEGYLLSLLSEKPGLSDTAWKTSETLNVYGVLKDSIKDINLYVWAKDVDGNLAMYEFYFEGDIYYMAQYYDHLQWYLDNPYSKIVDGVIYDLQALKEEYGDLYRFVEPLTNEDVEYRFQYLAEFFQIQVQDGDFERYNGGISDFSDDVIRDELYELRDAYYEKMGKTNDEKLNKYNGHYVYVDKIGKYSMIRGGTFSKLMTPESMIEIIDLFSYEEKDWYVREYMTEVDIVLTLLEKHNEFPKFNFKAEQGAKK